MSRRIAVVIDPWEYPYNGTVVSTRRFVFALETQGYEFELLAIEGDWSAGSVPDRGFRRLSVPGFNRIINAMRAPLARPDRAKLETLLKGCDLLHVQYPFFLGASAISVAKKLGIPVICSFHVQPENILRNLRLPDELLTSVLYRVFVRYFYNRADRVVAPSGFAADLLARHGLERPVTVVSNGVPDRFFSVVQKLKGETFKILSVGRLAREKQQETLLEAVARSGHRSRIELILAGVGPREQALVDRARALDVHARIGWIDDQALLDHYSTADLFVHAGTIELEGMSVLEAMAASNTVIVSDSADSACAAFVTDPRARFRMGDAADLAQRIDYWLDRPERMVEQGRANRRYAATVSHASTAAALSQLYQEFLGQGQHIASPQRRLTGTS